MKDGKIHKFLKRKVVVQVIGENYKLSPIQHYRLAKWFDEQPTLRSCENWFRTIAFMIKFDLTNYVGRIRRLAKMSASPNKYAFMLRYGRHYSSFLNQSSDNKTKQFRNRVDFWLAAGLTLSDASLQVSIIQKQRFKPKPIEQYRSQSVRCVEYWISKGFDPDTAKNQVSRIQRRIQTIETIKRRAKTMSLKSPDELAQIKIKCGHSMASYAAKGYDEQTALKLSVNYFKNRNNFSSISQTLFDKIRDGLQSECYYKTNNHEFQFNGKNVDFYHPESNTVIEFYGDFWHRNPCKYNASSTFHGKSSFQIWKEDFERCQMILNHPLVFRIIIIWESNIPSIELLLTIFNLSHYEKTTHPIYL